MGKSRRVYTKRFEKNVNALRDLIDSRSPSIVRDRVEASQRCLPERLAQVPAIGERSGTLTITGYILGDKGGIHDLIVKCDCNSVEFSTRNKYTAPMAKSCPSCATRKQVRKVNRKFSDAMSDTQHRKRLLGRLSAAIGRCHNPENAYYIHYGARGLSVYTQWRNDRTKFLEYIQTIEGWDNPDLEMDRVDNSKGYMPGNLRFVCKKENIKNRRTVRELQAEVESLRHSLRRAEEQIYRLKQERADNSS